MIKKIDHIGVAVKSIDQALALFGDSLGLEMGGTDEVATQKVKVAFLPIGDTRFELLEPTSEESNIAKFLDSRGEGMHHIAMEVDDIDEALVQLKAKGVRLINQEPVAGAHNTRIAFIHPKGSHGLLLEVVEKAKK